jgi:hypothetical protein
MLERVYRAVSWQRVDQTRYNTMKWDAFDTNVSERTICKTGKKQSSLNYWFRPGQGEKVILFENFIGQVLLHCTQKHCLFILHC